jgi:hypothetical protein
MVPIEISVGGPPSPALVEVAVSGVVVRFGSDTDVGYAAALVSALRGG